MLAVGTSVLLAACTAARSEEGPTATTRRATPAATSATTTTTATTEPPRTHATRPIATPVTAVGDSVLVDAAPALRARVPGIVVDAAVDRSALRGLDVLRADATSGRLGASIVFALGSNGGVTAPLLDSVIGVAAGRRVVVVTSHCPYCSWTSAENSVVRTGCTRERNCVVADWDRAVGAHPEWLVHDGVHMTSVGPGASTYAQLVLDALESP